MRRPIVPLPLLHQLPAALLLLVALDEGSRSSVAGFSCFQQQSSNASLPRRRQGATSAFVALRSSVLETSDATTSAAVVPKDIKKVWGIEPDISNFPGANFPLGNDGGAATTGDSRADVPPILEIPNFLTSEECSAIKCWATCAINDGAEECGDYLNARVNGEVDRNGKTEEGEALIDEFDLPESTLSASHRGGFRIRIDDHDVIKNIVAGKLLDVLGMKDDKERTLVFEEGAWIRPTPKTLVVRDQTVVLYGPGHGVPPHVDGKDGTLLVYLSDGECLRSI